MTSPVVAITSRRDAKSNGMVSDGAIRASIVPDIPRVGVFIHKFNFTHELVYETGRFGLHVLHAGQVDIVHKLGFFSGRDRDKLADIPHHLGPLDLPVLEDCYCWFACEVSNVMDTGSSTFFLGEVRANGRGPGMEIMEPAALRAGLPESVIRDYMAKLAVAQAEARRLTPTMRSAYARKS
jgi:flavin reductase (DIM6/NTAB) family NADH-FMN oxidoreductase RutF